MQDRMVNDQRIIRNALRETEPVDETQIVREVSEEEAAWINRPKQHTFDHPEASREWTEQQMREVAQVIAHDEVYKRDGERDLRAEKGLKRFAADESERRTIHKIIVTERLRAVEQAKLDPDWKSKRSPRIETDEELRSRLKRRRLIPFGVLAAIGLAVVMILVNSSGDGDYKASVSTQDRSARVDTIQASTRNGETKEMSSDANDFPARGEVITDLPIGKTGDVYSITATGEGEITCVIADKDSGKRVVETGTDSVTCTLE